jgi:hypothetical protein
MKQCSTLVVLIAAVAVPLLFLPLPAAAEEVTVTVRAVGHEDPFVFSWLEDAEGKLSFDSAVEEQIYDLFSGVHILFTDQNRLILAHPKGNELQQVFSTMHERHTEDGTFAVVHMRSQDRTLFINGTVERFSSDPKRGFAQWNVLMIGAEGNSISTIIQQSLTFPTSSTGGN